MAFTISPAQQAEKAPLDTFNRQAYLGNQFIASVGAITMASVATEYPLLCMTNSSSPSSMNHPAKSCYHMLRKLSCGDITGTTGVTFRVYFNPTGVSGGTPVVPVNVRTGSAVATISTVLSQPTVSTKGTLLATFAVGWANQNESDALLIVDPGDSLLITGQPVVGSTTALAEAIWYEI